jgi:hypothetical protein
MHQPARNITLANLLGLVVVLAVNYLSNSLPLNGRTPGELSDQYPNLFTPIGFTFSIWGIIYLWLMVWVGYQASGLFSKKTADQVAPALEKTGYLFAYSCLLNVAWLFAWHWEQLLVSVVIMANLLYILVQLNRAAGVGFSATNKTEKWLSHIPFGIYQGWISVALIANVTAWLVGAEWGGAGIADSVWAVLMVSTGALVAVFMVWKQHNLGHGLAVCWALFGIYSKQSALEGNPQVALAAMIWMVVMLILMAFRWKKLTAY